MLKKSMWSIVPSSGTRRRIKQGITLEQRYHVVGRLPSQGRCDRYAIRDLIGERHLTLVLPRAEHEGGYTRAERAELAGNARRLLALRHPGLCILDLLELEDERGYLTDQWVRSPLSEVVEANGPLDEQRALHVMTQVADVMQSAHSAGVLHKNLAPHSLFLRPGDDHIAVCDFGLFVPDTGNFDADEFTLTEANTERYLSAYLPPEQVTGEVDVSTVQADIWSFGVCLFFALTGELPFAADTLGGATQAIPRVDVEAVTAHVDSPELRNILIGCLQPSTKRRFADMSTVHESLLSLRQGHNEAREAPDSWARRVVRWSMAPLSSRRKR